ncbi:hypothetical protein [Leifsonia poae]|uniref:Uncharacterized protein n=1 Tax=Leifsonia poae TaxID=110933 RepID=A0A9W6M1A8_9MICO|nr:hypothetical protein [Leifsonia poae]GLJ78268.1 hypothetical protein GCM10017584_38420 [Leifsonia poae]
MRRRLTIRMSVEGVIALIAAIVAIVTLIQPQWIERLTGLDPDEGSGTAEWLVVAALALIAVVFAVLAAVTGARLRSARD